MSTTIGFDRDVHSFAHYRSRCVARMQQMPAAGETSCEMCFYSKEDGSNLDVVETNIVHKFVCDHTVATPFVFAYLQTLCKKKPHLKICKSCESWIHRKHVTISVKGGLGPTPSAMKTLLPADRLILSVLLPGVHKTPEARHVERYTAVLRMHGGLNLFATICPRIVTQALLGDDICTTGRLTLKSIAFATWNSGRQQTVFGNKTFAKNVRQSTL
jgi:hypothetical protein